jgi:hypothetical protein
MVNDMYNYCCHIYKNINNANFKKHNWQVEYRGC